MVACPAHVLKKILLKLEDTFQLHLTIELLC